MLKFNNFFILIIVFLTFFFIRGIMATEQKELIHLELKDGLVVIEARSDLAPKHLNQIKKLIKEGQYDGVVFHRVIEGFMAQTGDVQFGNSTKDSYDISRAGTGGSSLPDIEAEFTKANHSRGAVSMARAQNPDSANSQFFICFDDASFLDGQYSIWGYVIKGMEFVDNIKMGEPPENPDKIIEMKIASK